MAVVLRHSKEISRYFPGWAHSDNTRLLYMLCYDRYMRLETEADIRFIVQSDQWMMQVLEAAESLGLPNWWIGAGFLRNKIWDTIEGVASERLGDVDLVYFDSADIRPETDWKYDEIMHEKYPFAEWEIRNQARMHDKTNVEPYNSTEDGISNWVETATCIGVRLIRGHLSFLWCYGIEDVISVTARPTERFQTKELLPVFRQRVNEKGWRKRWKNIRVFEN